MIQTADVAMNLVAIVEGVLNRTDRRDARGSASCCADRSRCLSAATPLRARGLAAGARQGMLNGRLLKHHAV